MIRLNAIESQRKRLFLINVANSGLVYKTSKFLLDKYATVIICFQELHKGERAKREP